ncbi:MAG: hypothetical protein AB2L07_13500 [Thermoanaerobaculaceae bacterium]
MRGQEDRHRRNEHLAALAELPEEVLERLERHDAHGGPDRRQRLQHAPELLARAGAGDDDELADVHRINALAGRSR